MRQSKYLDLQASPIRQDDAQPGEKPYRLRVTFFARRNLAPSRLIATPLLSGLAGIGGVLVTVMFAALGGSAHPSSQPPEAAKHGVCNSPATPVHILDIAENIVYTVLIVEEITAEFQVNEGIASKAGCKLVPDSG